VVQTNDLVYHNDCFACVLCNHRFTPGQHFAVADDGNVYCPSDFQFRQLSAAAAAAVPTRDYCFRFDDHTGTVPTLDSGRTPDDYCFRFEDHAIVPTRDGGSTPDDYCFRFDDHTGTVPTRDRGRTSDDYYFRFDDHTGTVPTRDAVSTPHDVPIPSAAADSAAVPLCRSPRPNGADTVGAVWSEVPWQQLETAIRSSSDTFSPVTGTANNATQNLP